MSATDMPGAVLRFARTTGPFSDPAPADWVTLSNNKPERMSTRAGRPSPLDRVPPTELVIVLDNADGNLDPRNAASPYFPDVKPGKHVELVITPDDGLGDRVLFRGYVERWQPMWDKGRAVVEVTAKDAKALFARHKLWESIAEKLVLESSPRNYWPMADVSAIVPGAASSSTHNQIVDSRPFGLEQGVQPASDPFLPWDPRSAINFAGPFSQQYGTVTGLVADNNNANGWTVELLFHPMDDGGGGVRILDGQGFYLAWVAGSLDARFVRASDSAVFTTTSVALKVERTHLIQLSFTSAKSGLLYVNGSHIGTVSVGSNIVGHYLGIGYAIASRAVNPVYAKCRIGRMAAWDVFRGTTEHSAMWDALSAPWSGDVTMADRFGTLLTTLGWPLALRSVTSPSSSRAVERMVPGGEMALEYLNRLEDSDGGYIYVTPGGVLTFSVNTPPATFTAATLGTGAGELPYASGVMVIDGVDDVVTEVDAALRSETTPILVSNTAAKDAHGTITRPLENLLNTTRSQGRAVANELLNRYRVERPRVEKLVLYPRRADTGWSVPLAARTGEGYRFKHTPEAGAAVDWNTSVLTVNHDADWQAATWTTTLSLLWEADAV